MGLVALCPCCVFSWIPQPDQSCSFHLRYAKHITEASAARAELLLPVRWQPHAEVHKTSNLAIQIAKICNSPFYGSRETIGL